MLAKTPITVEGKLYIICNYSIEEVGVFILRLRLLAVPRRGVHSELVADLRLGFGGFLLGLYDGVLLTEGCCWEVLGGVGGGGDGAGVAGCYEKKTMHTQVWYMKWRER